MLVKKFFHWLCFFTVLGSFTLLTVRGAGLKSVTSVEEALAEGIDGLEIEEGDVLFDLPGPDLGPPLRLQQREQGRSG